MTRFARPGDMFAIDRNDGGWGDLDFTPRASPVYRLLLLGDLLGERLVLRLELPGGAVLDRRDPHYRDLLDGSYLMQTPFDVPFTIDEVLAAGESRWELR
jgi:hypothetical protein